MTQKPLTLNTLKAAIIAVLSRDLLSREWQALVPLDAPQETGHCAVASEAAYHLIGGRAAGYIPTVCGYWTDASDTMHFRGEGDVDPAWQRETHWWLTGPSDAGVAGAGKVYDVTSGQYDAPFPYAKGKNAGFMQPQRLPSKRARIVMDRVIAAMGETRIAALRDAQIAAFTVLQENARMHVQTQKPRTHRARGLQP